MRSRRIRSPSRRERRPSRALQIRPALAFASPAKEESLPWMQAGSPTCRPTGHYGAEWNARMKLAAAANCREASGTLAPLRTKVLRPRSANVRDDMSPNGPGTHCRLPAKPDGFRRECCLSHGQPGVAAALGGLASSERDERLVTRLIFSWRFLGDFPELPGSRRIKRRIWLDGTEFQGTGANAPSRLPDTRLHVCGLVGGALHRSCKTSCW